PPHDPEGEKGEHALHEPEPSHQGATLVRHRRGWGLRMQGSSVVLVVLVLVVVVLGRTVVVVEPGVVVVVVPPPGGVTVSVNVPLLVETVHHDEVGHACRDRRRQDRKSTRLNSSHVAISYAVFCLKKKKKDTK